MWLAIEFELCGSKFSPIIESPYILHVSQTLLYWFMILGPIMWVEIGRPLRMKTIKYNHLKKYNQSKHFKILFLLAIFLQVSLHVVLLDEVPSKEVGLLIEYGLVLKKVVMTHRQMLSFMSILHITSGVLKYVLVTLIVSLAAK
jgi:hypothetical protein